MKKLRLIAVLSLIIPVFLISCDKEDEEADPMDMIYTSWIRTVIDAEGVGFNAELRVNENNSYDFIVLDTTSNNTDSSAEFTLEGNVMTIINDNDCNVVGTYSIDVSSTIMVLSTITDPCFPREIALEGNWQIR